MQPRLVVGEALQGLGAGSVMALPDGATRHIQVLRLQPGDEVWLLDGEGLAWVAHVAEMGRKAASVRLEAPLVRAVELPVRLSMLVGVPANDRMDALVEKATELGVWSIHPVLCERAVWRADGARADKKVAHWQGVAQAAAEQSGRMVVPKVQPVCSLAAALKSVQAASPSASWHVLNPRATSSWGDRLDALRESALTASSPLHWVTVSGPEGGLTDQEVAECESMGAQGVRLGPRILRADTAPLSLLAAVSAALER